MLQHTKEAHIDEDALSHVVLNCDQAIFQQTSNYTGMCHMSHGYVIIQACVICVMDM